MILPLSVLAAATALSGCVVPAPASREASRLVNVSCPTTEHVAAQPRQAVDRDHPDEQQVARAFQDFVNRERCSRGLEPLGLSIEAGAAAEGHAVAMAEHDFMGHVSRIPGRETLKDRLDAENTKYRRAGENVGMTSVTSLSTRGSECLNGETGSVANPEMPAYRTVAKAFTGMWMNSPGHRDNILNPDFRLLGAGLGVEPDRGRCGEIGAVLVVLE